MNTPQIHIACPSCEWEPDGEIYWKCSCGHRWNTFETQGKCPACSLQWEETWCPGCGKTNPEKDWYHDLSLPPKIDSPEIELLKKRKRKLEKRLIDYGIRNSRISYLPYLDHSAVSFQTPYQVGCRIVILFSLSHRAHNPRSRREVSRWLKREKLSPHLSPREKAFLGRRRPSKEELGSFTWGIESALVLAWALGIIPILPQLDADMEEATYDDFYDKLPDIGADTHTFLSDLSFRNRDDIFEENILNEMATGYFRDLLFNGKEDETQINRLISFERHKALNWLRKFESNDEWDQVGTST